LVKQHWDFYHGTFIAFEQSHDKIIEFFISLTKIATIELVIKCIKIDGKVVIITYQGLSTYESCEIKAY